MKSAKAPTVKSTAKKIEEPSAKKVATPKPKSQEPK